MMSPGLASWAKFSRPSGTAFENRFLTHALKPRSLLLTARLKSCPDTKHESGGSQRRMSTYGRRLLRDNLYVTSAGKNSNRESIFTGRSVRYLNLKALGAAFPLHLGARTDQFDLSNWARVVCRFLRQRLDHDLATDSPEAYQQGTFRNHV